jgi:hypothetical protein
MRSQFPEHAAPSPRSLIESDQKEYCTYWIRHGECDYMQQGCRYKHDMPDLMTLRSIGFRNVPEWYRERMNRRPLRTHPDVLQSILNRKPNDSSSETDSNDSDATLAEVTRSHINAPVMPLAQNATVPAPSTFDLLSFDDNDEEQPQQPKAPNTTPENSSYALNTSPTISSYAPVSNSNLSPNRQGRFIPAGEELPRMSTPTLQPSLAFPTVEKKEELKVIKVVYTPPARAAPVFNQYFKEHKATKSQEKLQLAKKEEEGVAVNSTSSSDSDKDAQIAELQAKLAELAAATRTSPRTAPSPKAAIISASPKTLTPTEAATTTFPAKNTLMTSKHAEVQAKGRSRTRTRCDPKASGTATTGKSRRFPTGRLRKVVSSKAAAPEGVEKEKVVMKK